MTDDFKFWFSIIASAFGGGITAYIAVQTAYWKINGKVQLMEKDIQFLHAQNHDKEQRLRDLEDGRVRSRQSTPL